MGAYKKVIGGGVVAGLGARYVYNKHNEKIASENAAVAREIAAKARAADKVRETAAKARATVSDNKPSVSSAMDKVRGAVSHAKDTAKEAYSQFSHNPKAQMIAGGTAAALGAGLAAKRYLQRKKKK